MAENNESKKEEQVPNPVAPMYTIQLPANHPLLQQQIAPPFYYFEPQQNVIPSSSFTATPMDSPFEQEWDGKCRNKFWKCGKGRCCDYKDDGRELGSQTHFISSLVFGSLFPFVSLLAIFGMETSKLSRIGVLYGHANILFTAALAAITIAVHHHNGHFLKIVLPITLVLAIIFLICAKKSFRRFLMVYKSRTNKKESELVPTISEVGTRRQFIIAAIISFILPVIGTLIMLIARRRYLKSRFGALFGFGLSGVICAIRIAIKRAPHVLIVVLFGLMFLQILCVHFRRAILCAEKDIAEKIPCTTA